jgi:EAL domain-containing protein (putative c-di-GMP-specific phosphodiesterase class I)
MAEPMQLAGRELRMGASVGGVLFHGQYQQVEDVVRDADTALHTAKQTGRNRYVEFKIGMRDAIEQRFKVESDLAQALDLRQFELFFQPIVLLTDLSHAGFEALVRWRHPTHGFINPAQFIEIAEETGQIRELGQQILEMAMQAIAEWKQQGLWKNGWYVSINVSGGQLVDDSLIQELEVLQSLYGVDCQDIRLELTETAVISNLEAANRIFPAIRARGVALCMDDFGTGYSSLSYLSDLPFNVLKIDKSFVDELVGRSEQQALVRAVLSMARELGMLVVAEGLEELSQVAILQGMQCGYGQGYYFSRPLAYQAATDWLQRKRGDAAIA